MNDLRTACREAVDDLQKLSLSGRLAREDSTRVVAIVCKLRLAMRKHFERERIRGAMARFEDGKPPRYPTA